MTVKCANCGGLFEREEKPRGRPRIYCDAICTKRAQEWRVCQSQKARGVLEPSPSRREPTPPPPPRPCRSCGEDFQPTNARHIYCSRRCALAPDTPGRVNRNAKIRKGPATQEERRSRTCSVDGCKGKHLARGLCARHYRALRRSEGHNDGYLRNGDDRERAAYWSVPYEPIDRAAVFARDDWKCHLCGELVDRLALFPDPDSPSVDHVVPMSRGGGHLWSNVATAHLGCNVRKGAGRVEKAPCLEVDCLDNATTRGYCGKHYRRRWRAGEFAERSAP